MKNLIFFIFIAFLASCGQEKSTRLFNTTDPALAPYVTKFEAEGKSFHSTFVIGDVPVNFGEMEDPSHKGVCITYTDGTKEVLILKEWWDNQSEEFKESLVFHELGHCSLGREHKDEKFAVGGQEHKISMMNSTILSPSQYTPNRDAYLKELFTFEVGDVVSSLSR